MNSSLQLRGQKGSFDASSMLALCFKEKDASTCYQPVKKGNRRPRYNESEFLSLKYDLGIIYEEIGETDEAYIIYGCLCNGC